MLLPTRLGKGIISNMKKTIDLSAIVAVLIILIAIITINVIIMNNRNEDNLKPELINSIVVNSDDIFIL